MEGKQVTREEGRAIETKNATNVLGLKVAPVKIPMARRLQTFAVLFWISSFMFSGIFATWFLTYLILYTRFWPIPIIYLTFMWWDRDTANRGGRKGWIVHWCRNLKIWKHYADFFPIKIVKTAELDPGQNYLLGSHPHGILCTGAFSAFATEGCGFSALYPGIEPHLLTLEVQFQIPLHRELAYSVGGCVATKRGMSVLLQREKGVATILVPGGARESLNGDKDQIRLVLNSRKGFIKLALQHGVALVPTFSFGEHRVYDLLPNPPGSILRRIQDWFLAKTTIPIFLFMGRGIFQYSSGIVPHCTPIHVVIGKPIPVDKVSSPTSEEVERLHSQYVESLTALYREYNPKYGDPGVDLVIE